MPCYDNIDGALRLTSGLYDNVEGTLRTVQTGYDNIDGALRQYHTSSLDLYNSGVKDVAIAYQSGMLDYSRPGYSPGPWCGGWDDGNVIHIVPQTYRDSDHGSYPSVSAQVDFAVCDWYSRYLCITFAFGDGGDYGKAHIYAKNGPNGSVLKELTCATTPYIDGYNAGSGTRYDAYRKENLYGFGAFGLPVADSFPNRVCTLCADLSLMTTRSWSLSIQKLYSEVNWGLQYSPYWKISRIWQSDEIPAGVQFISRYTQRYSDGVSTTTEDFGMDWFNNAF